MKASSAIRNFQSVIVNRQSSISTLPSKDVPLAARIGAAAQRAGSRVDARGDDAGGHRVRTEDAQLVAPCGELVADARWHAIFDLEHSRKALVVVERAEWVQRVDP